MISCGKDCGACTNAKQNGNKMFCLFYGIPIWGRKKKHEETTRNDQDLRGMRERDHPDSRMGI